MKSRHFQAQNGPFDLKEIFSENQFVELVAFIHINIIDI